MYKKYHCYPQGIDMTLNDAYKCENLHEKSFKDPTIRNCNYEPKDDRLCSVLLRYPSKECEERWNKTLR
jgi:hypothetical protein